jgi:excinuclease ABC subunit A
MADYIIDMGLEGGRNGGRVVVTGTPEEVAHSGKGYTSRFLLQEISGK